MVVTGAGPGIGRGIAMLFAREGAAVAAVDADGDAAHALAGETADGGGAALALAADVSDAAAAHGCVDDVRRAWGGNDVLVTAAAVSFGGTATAPDEAAWDQVLRGQRETHVRREQRAEVAGG